MQQGAYLQSAGPEDAERIWLKRTLEKLVEKKSTGIGHVQKAHLEKDIPGNKNIWNLGNVLYGNSNIFYTSFSLMASVRDGDG